MKRAAELVFVSIPGIGHLVSMFEFAKRLIAKDDRFSITILNMKPYFSTPTKPYLDSISNHSQFIKIIDLPRADPPSSDPCQSPENYILEFIENHVPMVRSALTNLVQTPSRGSTRVAGLVLDFLCASMVDVATELGLPAYFFSPSGAGFLGLNLNYPTRQPQPRSGSQDAVSIRSFANPVPAASLPLFLLNEYGYAAMRKNSEKFRDVKGIILNSFVELEPYAINSFSGDQTVPPIYPVGPVVEAEGQGQEASKSDRAQWDGISDWLDAQPPASVVFLCFGSFGSFGVAQIREMAVGLEQSGHGFLWSLRLSAPDGEVACPTECADPAELLPEGFLDRTVGKGRICGWVPQAKVLAHGAVGGFVSHCGWNSVLESLWNGVPIAAWPLYAEQHLNAFSLVKELGLGVEMRLSYGKKSGDLVAAEEVERAVRCLMDGGSAARKSAREMREKSRRTLMEGGSSFLSLERLIEDMIGGS